MSEVYDCADPTARSTGLEAALRAVQGGSTVVAPADSSYALVGDAFSAAATAHVRTLKASPAGSPLSVFVGSWTTVDGLVSQVPAAARELIEAFWPGDLSLVLHHAPSLRWDIGSTKGTVTLRMPLHPVLLELLRAAGPLAASAAPGGEARTAAEVDAALGDGVAVYLDAGRLTPRPRSTIVDLTGSDVVVLREGAVPASSVEEVVGRAVVVA